MTAMAVIAEVPICYDPAPSSQTGFYGARWNAFKFRYVTNLICCIILPLCHEMAQQRWIVKVCLPHTSSFRMYFHPKCERNNPAAWNSEIFREIMAEYFTAVTIQCVCQKIRSVFRELGMYNFDKKWKKNLKRT